MPLLLRILLLFGVCFNKGKVDGCTSKGRLATYPVREVPILTAPHMKPCSVHGFVSHGYLCICVSAPSQLLALYLELEISFLVG